MQTFKESGEKCLNKYKEIRKSPRPNQEVDHLMSCNVRTCLHIHHAIQHPWQIDFFVSLNFKNYMYFVIGILILIEIIMKLFLKDFFLIFYKHWIKRTYIHTT